MLQRIRDGLHGRKWLAWIALFPIALIFVFWGGSNTLDLGGVSAADAAKVDGEKIPADEASKAWSEMQARWSQQFGADIPDEQRVKMQDSILEQLILQKLIEKRLTDEHYRVSNAKVLAEFQAIPAFQGPDGKFDVNTARSLLRQVNKSEEQFFDEMRKQLLTNQLQQGIQGSYFLTRAEALRLHNLENEEREIQYVQIPADKFAGSEQIDEAAVKAYFDKNNDRFMTTEFVTLEYAELRREQLATQVVPTEDQLKELYEKNKASYVQDEQRRMRHIVIPIVGEDDAGALKQAQAVLADAKSG